MPLDLFEKENSERVGSLPPMPSPDVGAWDGFVRGTAMGTVRGFLKAGRAVDLAGAVGPMAEDAFTGGTTAQDRYFKEHDDLYQSAIDWWTPRSNEVGAAADIASGLLSTLPLAIINPAVAVGTTQLSIGEDLIKKGVDPAKAQVVAGIQAAGLGLGISVPILGNTLTQRIAFGTGFNAVQGVAMRGASQAVLKGTPAEDDYHAFDGTSLTLDVLLGAAFGGITHLSPEGRAHSASATEALTNWAKGIKPSEIDALAVLRQSQHLNVDSLAGKPVEPIDIERHVQRMRQAIDQLARDKPIDVSDLPRPNLEADPVRLRESEQNVKTLAALGEDARVAEGLPRVPESEAPAAMRGSAAPSPPPSESGAITAGAEGTTIIKPKTVAEMSADELRAEIMRDPLTGIKNRRAFDDAEASFPVRGSVDADGLKWINDNLGHDAGDTLLRTLGHALNEATDGAFRIGGDEFAIGAKSADEARAILESVRERLQDAVITVELPDGSQAKVKGVSFSYGIGETSQAADAALKANKAEREQAGVRPARGSAPAGITREPAQGKPGSERGAAGQEEVNLLADAAQRFVAENPDVMLHVGDNADGTPILKTSKEFLDDAHASAEDARSQVGLFEAAADCLLGRVA